MPDPRQVPLIPGMAPQPPADQQTPQGSGNSEPPAQPQPQPQAQPQEPPQPAQPQPPAEPETPKSVHDRAVDFIKNADQEVAEYLAKVHGAQAVDSLLRDGVLVEADKAKPPDPEPEPPAQTGPPPEFNRRMKQLLREAQETGDVTNLYWEIMNAAQASAVNISEQKFQEMLKQELEPFRQQYANDAFVRAEREFFQAHPDLDQDLQQQMSKMMKDPSKIEARQILEFTKQYKAKLEDRTRQEAAAQAARRSEANTTGYAENPQRGGFDPPAEHQNEDLRKKIVDSFRMRGGDEAQAREYVRRWQSS